MTPIENPRLRVDPDREHGVVLVRDACGFMVTTLTPAQARRLADLLVTTAAYVENLARFEAERAEEEPA